MALWDKVVGIVNPKVMDLARTIEGELKAEIADGHIKSGKAYQTTKIQAPGSGFGRAFPLTGGSTKGLEGGGLITNVRIGSYEPSAYYLNNGNGGKGRTIKPTRSKALRITDGRGNTKGFARSVQGYDGIHYVEKVAERHK